MNNSLPKQLSVRPFLPGTVGRHKKFLEFSKCWRREFFAPIKIPDMQIGLSYSSESAAERARVASISVKENPNTGPTKRLLCVPWGGDFWAGGRREYTHIFRPFSSFGNEYLKSAGKGGMWVNVRFGGN